jgi:diaminopimelate epimerase
MTYITRTLRGGWVADRFQALLEDVDKIPAERIRPLDLRAEMFSQKLKVKVCTMDSMSKICLRTFEHGH